MKVTISIINRVEGAGEAGVEVLDEGGELAGVLYITTEGLLWCAGDTPRGSGKLISWDEYIALASQT